MNIETRSPVLRLATGALIVLGLIRLAPALAGDSDNAYAAGPRRSITVSIRDLDLTSSAGLRTAHARFDAAARRVCGHYDRRDPDARRAWKRCHESALSAAVAAFDAQAAEARLEALLDAGS